MNTKSGVALVALLVMLYSWCAHAENIDPDEDDSQYAYSENVGWLNFEPNEPNAGATVSNSNATGFVWAAHVGWINLDPNDSDPNTGITNDGAGNLSGLAWGENIGWINFDPNVPGDVNNYGVAIDPRGNFHGYAWGENIGWINFDSVPLFGYGAKACKVNSTDLGNFVGQWLESECNEGNNWCEGADLWSANQVDLNDYSVLAAFWLGYCPDGWPLK